MQSSNNNDTPRNAAAIEKMIEASTEQTAKIISELALYEQLIRDLNKRTTDQSAIIEQKTSELATLTAQIESLTTESQSTSAKVTDTQQQIEQYKAELASILQKTGDLKKLLFGVQTPKMDAKFSDTANPEELDAPDLLLKTTAALPAVTAANQRKSGKDKRTCYLNCPD